MDRVSIFSLHAGRQLAERIADHLGAVLGHHEERDFEDGEHKIRPLESVRGRDVYVVQSLFGEPPLTVNDKLIRVLFLIGALRDAGAGRVTCVAPYLCYARKDRRTKPRDPVSTRYVAGLFEAAGIDRMVTVDVHNPAAYENAFRVPAEHLTGAPLLIEGIAPWIGEVPAVVVSPDAGGVKRAEAFRQSLERRLERAVGFAFFEKFRSEGVVRGGAVAGEVDGRVAIIVDDLVSSGTTLARAAEGCRERGARAVYAAATHGVFSAGAGRLLRDSAIERLAILDTVGSRRLDADLFESRVEVLDSAPLLAGAIERLSS